MGRTSIVLPLLLVATTSYALPRPNSAVVRGANHHVGDASFVEAHGRAPDDRDDEHERMHDHLAYIRAWLAARPATRPELAAKRAEILAHLDAYIAHGVTPNNAHVPWRTPVFIDDAGTICAVGYLIEQTVGRALPERIATSHRYDFIEDIAAEVPEVAAWVADSGFTLEEIASIQPAYEEPRANMWRTWDLARHPPADGPYDRFGKGTFRRARMEGAWTVATEDGKHGTGQFKHGSGTWTSYYADGARFAQGPYADNLAGGAWKIYYPSGQVAAEGAFHRGARAGVWHFYADTADKTPIAVGAFDRAGKVEGTWKHFDDAGQLAAVSTVETPEVWRRLDPTTDIDGGEGARLDVTAQPGETAYSIHQGTVGGSPQVLEAFTLGDERLFDHKPGFGAEVMYDANGFKLVHAGGAWSASDCGWSAARKHLAHRADLAALHGALYDDARRRGHVSGHDGILDRTPYDPDHDNVKDEGPRCGAAVAIGAERGARLDAMLASRDKVHGVSPRVVRDVMLAHAASLRDSREPLAEPSAQDQAAATNLAHVLAGSMTMYIEWPHIDGLFVDLYPTMPGRFTHSVHDGRPED